MSNYTHETVPTRFVETKGIRYAEGQGLTTYNNEKLVSEV
jgi:hypothetical protein